MATYSAPVLSENNHNVYIDIDETTNSSLNTSNISWKVYYKVEGVNSYFHYNNGNSLIVTLNGVEYYNGNPGAINVNYPGSKELAKGEFTFAHNADGTGSFSVYVHFKQSQKANCIATINSAFTCTTINRSYKLTFNPDPGTLRNPGGNLYNPAHTGSNYVNVTVGLTSYSNMNSDIPIRTGHNFIGWYNSLGEQVYNSSGIAVNGTYWNNGIWQYSGDVTVHAYWGSKSCSLTYDANGGLCIIYEYGEDGSVTGYSKHPTCIDLIQGDEEYYIRSSDNFLEHDGLKFVGWNTEPDGSGYDWTERIFEKWNWDWYIGEDITLYAQWSNDVSYTVTFRANGGRFPSTGTNQIQVTVKLGQSATLPENPVREGRIFKGWSGEYTNIQSNQVVQAVWDALGIWIMSAEKRWVRLE